MKSVVRHLGFACLVSLFLGAFPSLSDGALVFSVNLNTSSLIGNSAGPFYIEFQLNDGSGSIPGDGNNTVNISNFDFGIGGGGQRLARDFWRSQRQSGVRRRDHGRRFLKPVLRAVHSGEQLEL